MDHTPNAKSKLMCRRRNSIDSGNPTSSRNLTSTPTQSKQPQLYNLRNDSSPIYFQSTQEVIEDLDVVWDWNSPRSTKNKAQKQKRTFPSESVKVPLKRHVSHNQIHTFDKLKSDLEALRNHLNYETKNDPDKTSSDIKPLCDADVGRGNQKDLDLEALFEDSSVEEELFLCSQRVEETLNVQVKVPKTLTFFCNPITSNNAQGTCAGSSEANCNKKLNFEAGGGGRCNTHVKDIKKAVHCPPDFGNSSFDLALQMFKDEDADFLTQASINLQRGIYNVRNCDNIISNSEKEPVKVKCDLEEIKRKRLQALAKLKARKNHNTSPKKYSPDKMDEVRHNAILNETSPIKCSPEEIEQKRLQALAKLQVKKKQDVIERNRQEALKRLEINKKKRAVSSQRLLISRTHSR